MKLSEKMAQEMTKALERVRDQDGLEKDVISAFDSCGWVGGCLHGGKKTNPHARPGTIVRALIEMGLVAEYRRDCKDWFQYKLFLTKEGAIALEENMEESAE